MVQRKRLSVVVAVLAVSICTLSFAQASGPVKHLGVSLPGGSKKIDENRFQSSKSYEDTVKLLQANVSNTCMQTDAINLPHVRAQSFIHKDKKATYWGINVYLNEQSGLTEVFFLTESKKK